MYYTPITFTLRKHLEIKLVTAIEYETDKQKV